MKKIKASAIQPGMVIGIKRNKSEYDDICLATAKSGYSNVEYTHLDLQDAYGGLMIGSIDGKTLVEVVTGRKRKAVISKIKDDVFRNLHDTENIINTINLIEAMDKK